MKRILFLIFISFCLLGCKSKEEKAEELIKKSLFQSLYDFDSYSPIETIVKEAYEIPKNDSALFNIAVK